MMLNVLETVVRHASDSIDCFDASRLVESRSTVQVEAVATVVSEDGPQVRLSEIPRIEFSTQPVDLSVVARPGRLILWRQSPPSLGFVVDGRADSADLAPPVEQTFSVSGRLTFRSGRYNPRLFQVQAGAAAGHQLRVFQSPVAVFGDSGGILSASLRFEDGSPASWAIVTVRVQLPVADPAHTADRTYQGQADQRGELRMALTGLPSPTRAEVEADALDRTINVSVLANPEASGSELIDPDTLPAALSRGADTVDFNSQTQFSIRPGGLIRLESQSENHLSIRPSP